jgi:hypothetical protein
LANVNRNLKLACAVPGIISWARVNAAAIQRLDFWHKFGTVGGEIQRSPAKADDTKYLILQDSGERRPEVVALRRQNIFTSTLVMAPLWALLSAAR